MEGFEYKNIIPTLRCLFPAYMKEEEMNGFCSDEPGLYLTFLISYVGKGWNDLNTQSKLAELMNKMIGSNDADVRNTFTDFALDFYLHFEEHKLDNAQFMNKLLLPQTKHFIRDAANYWYRANNEYIERQNEQYSNK